MKIRKIMHTDVVTLQADEPLIRAVEILEAEHIRHLPILEGERLVGIVTTFDIKHVTPSPLLEGGQEGYHQVFDKTPVSRIMRRAPITASPNAALADVIRLMLDGKASAVCVVEGKRLVGIVSELDVLNTFLEVLKIIE